MLNRRLAALLVGLPAALVTSLSAGQPSPVASPVARASAGLDAERLLDDVDRERRQLKKLLAELAVEAKQAEARTLTRGRAYVRLARAGLLPVGGGFEATVDHASKIERLRRALGRDIALERKISQRRTELGEKLADLEARRGPLEAQARATAQARGALLAAQDRALAFQRAFETPTGSTSHTAIYGAGIGPTDPADIAAGFAAMKGRLPFPLPGRAEIRSARRPGTDGPGLEMRAPRGSPVRAVYGGRVAFADHYAAYGKTVIVDHGGRHYTISSNLEEILVQTGEDLTVGARLGSIGDSGDGPLLYLELRVGADTVDPAEWFGI